MGTLGGDCAWERPAWTVLLVPQVPSAAMDGSTAGKAGQHSVLRRLEVQVRTLNLGWEWGLYSLDEAHEA